MDRRRLMIVASLALLASAGCAPRGGSATPELVRARPSGANHALRMDLGSSAATDIVLDGGSRERTVALRIAIQHTRGARQEILGDGARGALALAKVDTRPELDIHVGGVVLAALPISAPRAWHHVAIVRRGANAAAYADGRLLASVVMAATTAGAALELGFAPPRDPRAAPEPIASFVGYVDDLWVVDAALEADELAALAAGAHPPEGARAWGFDFEPGTRLPALRGNARVAAAARDEPAPAIEVAQVTEMGLPVDGEWEVLQGFESGGTHVGYAAFALDLMPAEQRTARRTAHPRLRDFPCLGRPVRALADGVVVRAAGSAADAPPYVTGSGDGNFVIVEHAPGEATELRHLQRGSVRVRAGQRVQRGQVLGRCGNSGNATTPHLHIGFLSSVDPILTRPMRLDGYEVRGADGVWRPGGGTLEPGQVVRGRRLGALARARNGLAPPERGK